MHPTPGRSARQILGASLHVLGELAAMLLSGPPCRLARGPRGFPNNLATVARRLLPDLSHLLLEVVRQLPDLLVLDPRGGKGQPRDESDAGGADHQAEWVGLGDACRMADLLAAGHRIGDRRGGRAAGLADPRCRRAHVRHRTGPAVDLTPRLSHDGLLRPAFDICPISDRLDGGGHSSPSCLYLASDLVGCLSHSTSSLTVSTVCSTGFPAMTRFASARIAADVHGRTSG